VRDHRAAIRAALSAGVAAGCSSNDRAGFERRCRRAGLGAAGVLWRRQPGRARSVLRAPWPRRSTRAAPWRAGHDRELFRWAAARARPPLRGGGRRTTRPRTHPRCRSTAEQRGHGRRHTAALLDALDIERAHCVGYSMGGDVALQLALDRPGLVDHLVLSQAARPSTRAACTPSSSRESQAACFPAARTDRVPQRKGEGRC
jgi:pimeloyl-ACP methyl ester carboxylesterase